MSKSFPRSKTIYPGVYFITGKASDGRPEKIFYIIYRKNKKLIEEKAGRQFQDSMTAAKANQLRTRRIEGDVPTNRERREATQQLKWTVDRLWQEYSAQRPHNSNFLTDRSRYLKHVKPVMGHKEPKEIVPLDADRLRLKLGKIYKPQTVQHVLRLLQRLANYGFKKRLCPGIGFKIEMPQVHNLKTEDLNPEQLTALLEAIDQDWDIQAANFMRMVLFTGMRRGELFKLRWEDVDFDRGFIYIRHDPKGGKPQTIPLNQAAREVMEDHPRDESSPFVFPGRWGRQRTDIKRPVNRIKTRAGLPKDFRPLHGLRHVYASMLASSGEVDLVCLAKTFNPQERRHDAALRPLER